MKSRKPFVIAAAMFSILVGVYIVFSPGAESKKGDGVVTIPPMPEVNELPDLVVHMADQSKVNMRDLSGDVLVVFFNPDCDHCQEHARQMAENKSMFANWQVYFISSGDAKAAEDFAVNYRLNEPNYKFVHSPVADVFNAVGPLDEVPTILLYKRSRLVRKFVGPTPMDQLGESL